MRYPVEFKEKAIRLRKRGFSLKEISEKLGIAKSTASVWLRNVNLDEKARERLKKRQLLGYYKTQLLRRERKKKLMKKYANKAGKHLSRIKIDKTINKLLCSLLYWCEGAKSNDMSVRFVNSDPLMISAFLKLLRKSFTIDEKKFRAILHLHDYHNEKRQIRYWSKVTKIPSGQFNKTYRKPNTKKRIRDNDPGCIAIYYHDASIARRLISMYNIFVNNLGA